MTLLPPETVSQSSSEIPPLMTVNEIAKVLRVSTRSVWRLLTNGKIVKPIRIGGSIRWRRSDVAEWLAKYGATASPQSSVDFSSKNEVIDREDHGTIQVHELTERVHHANHEE